MNIAVIYHDADFDGKLSNEVCRYHLTKIHPEARIDSFGWDYGRPVPEVGPKHVGWHEGMPVMWEGYDSIYIVDLSVDELMARPELRDKIIWIDHHKSAIEKWDRRSEVSPGPGLFTGYRIDGVAACRLCWQWFSSEAGPHGDPRTHPVDVFLPFRDHFVERSVSEPELIRLAGEYDIWDHRDPNGKALQFGLRACSDREFRELVEWQFDGRPEGIPLLDNVVSGGQLIKSYCDRNNAEYASTYSQTIQWENLTFCALNIGQRGNSDLFAGGIKPEHDALFAWRWTGNAVLVSLYHAPGKEHHDLSQIAVRYGGGGHRGACGFRLNFTQLNTILTK